MERRSFVVELMGTIAAWFAGLFSSKPKEAEASCNWRRTEIPKMPVEGYELAGAPKSHSDAVKHGLPEELKDHNFLTVIGGVLPSHPNEHYFDGPKLLIRRSRPETEKAAQALVGDCEQAAWFDMFPVNGRVEAEGGKLYADRQFPVNHEIRVGTVDKLVDLYRANLIRACESVCGKEGERPASWEAHQEFQKTIADKWANTVMTLPVPGVTRQPLVARDDAASIAFDEQIDTVAAMWNRTITVKGKDGKDDLVVKTMFLDTSKKKDS